MHTSPYLWYWFFVANAKTSKQNIANQSYQTYQTYQAKSTKQNLQIKTHQTKSNKTYLTKPIKKAPQGNLPYQTNSTKKHTKREISKQIFKSIKTKQLLP